ncbi:MAG: 2,3,4,5-tetrahydropyridine-2,6-dicarboxylate N-succinyltransferase [Chlorobium sp.]|jgi:2,3,4,5-tetrahydropyridine-2,6-dicarboxylate N-succinyltransferase|nr:MAG: 2,3,4,5-tetrahydropyridine-2,6-dicarboxylate N-succinyltransferase [Chlorobium sp.]
MGQYDSLKQDILGLSTLGAAALWEIPEARTVFDEFKQLLNNGLIRAAEKSGDNWVVNSWVKEGILLGMRLGRLQENKVSLDGKGSSFTFIDKDTYPLKTITLDNNVRIVPGGSAVRDGSYLAPSVVMMPPAYVNVGAYVDEGTMIDSHALVGSCAQVGKKVHLSAGVQVGGVLEPVGAIPVVIEDEVMVGGNCGIYEGTIVRERAVIGTGVILNGSTPVYDLALNAIYRKTSDSPLVIPAGAVVVAGSRAIKGDFAAEHGLSIYTPVIIKYRDERTDSATALEEALR